MRETQNVEVQQISSPQWGTVYYLEPTCKLPDAVYDWIVTRHFTNLADADAAAEKVCKLLQDAINKNKDWYEAL